VDNATHDEETDDNDDVESVPTHPPRDQGETAVQPLAGRQPDGTLQLLEVQVEFQRL